MSRMRQQMTEMYHTFMRILSPKLLTRSLVYCILHSERDTSFHPLFALFSYQQSENKVEKPPFKKSSPSSTWAASMTNRAVKTQMSRQD